MCLLNIMTRQQPICSLEYRLHILPASVLTGKILVKSKNNGVELTIGSTNIQTKRFYLTTDFNVTKQNNKNKGKSLPEGNDIMYGDGNMYLLMKENLCTHSICHSG